jgi:hypothetical protein
MEDWHETDMGGLPVDVRSPGQNGSHEAAFEAVADLATGAAGATPAC